ncbi:MAG: hypothetical protein ABH879_10650 [archaeon]
MGKRGQITVFIIIAIVILFASALFFYLRGEMEAEPLAATVPQELMPVKNYVEECLTEITKDAVNLAGQQGGHVYLDEFDLVTPLIEPSVADVVSLDGGSSNIPYWFHQQADGIDRTAIPRIHKTFDDDNSVEDQLGMYVEENIDSCLDFSSFSGMTIEPNGFPEAEVTITEADVRVHLMYPMAVTRPGSVSDVSEFRAGIPVRLGKILEFAREITDYEIETQFLDRNTNNLIAYYSGVDPELLPPVGDLLFTSCANKVFWIAADVQRDFREMLAANIPFLRVDNGEHERVAVTSLDEPDPELRDIRQAVFDNMVHTVGTESYPGMEVFFSYDTSFPLKLEFAQGSFLEPKGAEIPLLFAQLCMLQYIFYYNVEYPVLITIFDRESDYSLQFPVEVVIHDNYPRVRLGAALNLTQIEEPSYDCLPAQRTSGMSEVHVSDEITGQKLTDALVYFQCGPSVMYDYDENGTLVGMTPFADKCLIGKTADGILKSRFPPCSGGIISIRHDGYLEKFALSETIEEGIVLNSSYSLLPIVEKSVNIMKHFVKRPVPGDPVPAIVEDSSGNIISCRKSFDESPVAGYERVMIRLEKLDPENGMYNAIPVMYSPVNDSRISIAPGKYLVDLKLLRYEQWPGEMTIKAKSQKFTYDKGFLQGTGTQEYPETDIDLSGGVFTGGAHFNWTVGYDIYDKNVTFFVFDEGKPDRVEDISGPLDHVEGCSRLNMQYAEPRLE